MMNEETEDKIVHGMNVGCLTGLVLLAAFFIFGAIEFSNNGVKVMPDGSRIPSQGTDWQGMGAGIFVGVLLLAIVWWAFIPHKTPSVSRNNIRVDNTIVGWDKAHDCLLVAAHSTWQIDGYNKNVSGNSPVGIHFLRQIDNRTNLYVLDKNHQFGSNHPDNPYCVQNTEFYWEDVPGGPWEYVPRGAGENWSGALADEMAGWSYNYIQPKGYRPDISAPGISIAEE
jgi:hypothetical protein